MQNWLFLRNNDSTNFAVLIRLQNIRMRALDLAPICFSSALILATKVSNFFGFLWSADSTSVQVQDGGKAARHASTPVTLQIQDMLV
eukprot:COSAG02_NODE_18021_length_965_cov_1.461894_3_plen_86_part_01